MSNLPSLGPRRLTFTVVDLARAVYDERAFERLPILADALMDTGCDDEQVIGHCRSEGPHVRGCWVVDLLSGKDDGLFRGQNLPAPPHSHRRPTAPT